LLTVLLIYILLCFWDHRGLETSGELLITQQVAAPRKLRASISIRGFNMELTPPGA
jgi:hypothetical protein